MSVKPVVPSQRATADAEAAIDWYLENAAPQAARGFVAALKAAYRHIGRAPGTGSPRHGHELEIPGLRSWPLSTFPYLVFYIEHDTHVDVLRVLHGQRDIPASLGPR